MTFQRAAPFTDSAGAVTPQRDWDNAVSLVVEGCTVQPVSSAEAWDAAGVNVTELLRVFGPRRVDLDVAGGDRALWGGEAFEVYGEPERWPAPGGGVHHVEIVLRRQPATHSGAVGVAAVLSDASRELASQARPWTP